MGKDAFTRKDVFTTRNTNEEIAFVTTQAGSGSRRQRTGFLVREQMMKPPRRLRPLSNPELERMTVARLIAFRKQALSLENSITKSDYSDIAAELDRTYIWFKEDPRWQIVYDAVLEELARKQNAGSGF